MWLLFSFGFVLTTANCWHVCYCTRETHPYPAATTPFFLVLMAEHGCAHGYHVTHDLACSCSGIAFLHDCHQIVWWWHATMEHVIKAIRGDMSSHTITWQPWAFFYLVLTKEPPMIVIWWSPTHLKAEATISKHDHAFLITEVILLYAYNDNSGMLYISDELDLVRNWTHNLSWLSSNRGRRPCPRNCNPPRITWWLG
jgi:hypothetical protein